MLEVELHPDAVQAALAARAEHLLDGAPITEVAEGVANANRQRQLLYAV